MSGLFKRNTTYPAPKTDVDELPPRTEPIPPVTGPTFSREYFALAIIEKALSQVGVKEVGFNSGAQIQEYQKVIGTAESEAWCMSFAQWCTKQVCTEFGIANVLHPSEHCLTVFNNTPEKYISKEPKIGSLFIHKTYGKESGHCGWVKETSTTAKFSTIEGNTNAAGSSEGDGVYESWRLITGTPTKSLLGFIDVPQMIYDTIYFTQGPESGTINLNTPNVKGDWNANLDAVIMNMVTPELINLPYVRMQKFIPGWSVMNAAERRRFFADLLFAMCRYESNYDAKCMYYEKDLGRDAITGLPVVSEGLLQMSYQDAKWYPIPFFTYATDADLFKSDWANRGTRAAWLSKHPTRTTLLPENGVKAAMIVMIKLLTNPKFQAVEFADTIGKYWSCMRRLTSSGSPRNSFAGINSILKSKGYKV